MTTAVASHEAPTTTNYRITLTLVLLAVAGLVAATHYGEWFLWLGTGSWIASAAISAVLAHEARRQAAEIDSLRIEMGLLRARNEEMSR